MARIDDFVFDDPNMDLFKDQIRRVLNFGKYATQVVTTVPSWDAQPGERVLFRPASGGTTEYFYAGSAWISGWSVTA